MKKKLVLFPFLFAIYPIIFLYSNNVREVMLSRTLLPMLVSLAVALALWGIAYLIIRDGTKAGLMTTVFVVAFFVYGYIFDLLSKLKWLSLSHGYMIPILLFIVGYIIYFIAKTKNTAAIEGARKLLNIIAIAIIVINLVIAIPGEIKKVSLHQGENTAKTQTTNTATASGYPDIYYILLDEYASTDTIKSIWNYDNSKLVNDLNAEGFYIADKTKVKYNETIKALPSYLNMGYVEDNLDELTYFKALTNSKVVDYLKSKGYTYIYFGNWFDLNRYKMNADYEYNYLTSTNLMYIDEFTSMLLKNTMARPILYMFEAKNNASNVEQEEVIYTFDKMRDVVGMKGPKFIFSHIMCPHTPFVFNSQGAKVDQANWYNFKNKEYYRDQYIYVSEQVDALVKDILKNSKTPPIIVVQSDHGPRPQFGPIEEQRMSIPNEDMFKIFNAYYLPGIDRSIFHPNMSPVNTFKIIFNNYFNEKFVLEEDLR